MKNFLKKMLVENTGITIGEPDGGHIFVQGTGIFNGEVEKETLKNICAEVIGTIIGEGEEDGTRMRVFT